MFLETHALQYLYVYAVLVFEAMATLVGQVSMLLIEKQKAKKFRCFHLVLFACSETEACRFSTSC